MAARTVSLAACMLASCATVGPARETPVDEPAHTSVGTAYEAWPVFDWRFVHAPGLQRAERLWARAADTHVTAALARRPSNAPADSREIDTLPTFERARDDLLRALNLAPTLTGARIELAEVLDEMASIERANGESASADARIEEALAQLERARVDVGDDARRRAGLLSLLGLLYTRSMRFEEARETYDALLHTPLSDRARGLALCNRAEIEGDLDDLATAIADYHACLALRPDAGGLWGLAVAYDRDGAPGMARRTAQRALAVDPALDQIRGPDVFFVPACEVHYYLALAHEAEGHAGDARDEWQAFLSLGGSAGRWAATARAHEADAARRAQRASDARLGERASRTHDHPARPRPVVSP